MLPLLLFSLALDPPAVDEARLAAKLVEMVKPSAGERAVIVYDPTYYPGITQRLREELHRNGVQTYAVVEDTESMIASYLGQNAEHDRRRDDVIRTLLPVFRASDIFYWMPARGYVNDLRWERLVEQSNVRSVHFHWILRFPDGRDAAGVAAESRRIERAALDVDHDAHARLLESVAGALRGHEVRVTAPNGTDVRMHVPADQWFHLGTFDASKERAAKARSVRDRQMEFPVGMFGWTPDAEHFSGIIVDSGTGGRYRLERGRVVEGGDPAAFAAVGPDGDRIGTVFLRGSNPHSSSVGVGFDIGANWENGGKNRAIGMRRLALRVDGATVTADGVPVRWTLGR